MLCVKPWYCQGLGQLVLVDNGQAVLFHLGQVLRPTETGQHAPYLETHTSAEVEWLLKPGTRVSLNARKIRGCYLPMQVKLLSIVLEAFRFVFLLNINKTKIVKVLKHHSQ